MCVMDDDEDVEIEGHVDFDIEAFERHQQNQCDALDCEFCT